MSALILDTETNSLNGYPIEIAYVPCSFEQGVLEIYQKLAFDEYFSCPEPIELGSMATHHILEIDITGKPSFEVFRLPENTEYLIGHNIDYDIKATKLCDPSISVKGICTLALARMVWDELETHNLTAMYYHVMSADLEKHVNIYEMHITLAGIFILLEWFYKQSLKSLQLKTLIHFIKCLKLLVSLNVLLSENTKVNSLMSYQIHISTGYSNNPN